MGGTELAEQELKSIVRDLIELNLEIEEHRWTRRRFVSIIFPTVQPGMLVKIRDKDEQLYVVGLVEPHVDRRLFRGKMSWCVLLYEYKNGTLTGEFTHDYRDADIVPISWIKKPPVLQHEMILHDKKAYVVLTQRGLGKDALVCLTDPEQHRLFDMPVKQFMDWKELTPKAESMIDAKVETTNKESRKQLDLADPKSIAEHLSSVVRSQKQACEKIAVAICDQLRKPAGTKKSNVLIVGPTGCGKTELSRQTAEMMKVPFAEAKMGNKTSSGYKDDSLASVFEDVASNMGKKGFERSVVLLDEIDKLRPDENEGFGKKLQNELIGWVESAIVNVPIGEGRHEKVKIDTTNMMFVGAGAFVGLEKIIAARVGYRGPLDNEAISSLYAEMMPEDLVMFGMKPELVGRFPVVTYVNQLNESDLIDIMKNGKKSAVDGQIRLLREGYGVDIEITDDAYFIMAKAASTLGTGARSIEKISNEVFHDIKFNVRELTQGGKTKISVDGEMAKQKLGRLLRN